MNGTHDYDKIKKNENTTGPTILNPIPVHHELNICVS